MPRPWPLRLIKNTCPPSHSEPIDFKRVRLRNWEGRLDSWSELGKIIRDGIEFAQIRALDRATGGSDTLRIGTREAAEDDRMRRKVLVVDDDPYLTTQLRKLLESEELSVDTVSSAQEALTALAAADYSVLITDLRMPGMGGMELIREVAQRRLLVTMIVTTGLRLDRPRGRGDAAGGLRLPDQADRPHQPEARHGPGPEEAGAAGRGAPAPRSS